MVNMATLLLQSCLCLCLSLLTAVVHLHNRMDHVVLCMRQVRVLEVERESVLASVVGILATCLAAVANVVQHCLIT